MCSTHWAEVSVAPRPFDLLPCSCHSGLIGAVCQAFGSHFTSQLIDLLDVLLLQGADGLEAARQAGFELLSVGERLAALPGLVFDTQGFQEEVQLVRGAVGDEHLDVFREQLDGALPISDEFGEQFELFHAVTLRDFSVVDPEDNLLELVPAQDNGGFTDNLPPSGLTGGVQLLHRHTALQLGTLLPGEHDRNLDTRVHLYQ